MLPSSVYQPLIECRFHIHHHFSRVITFYTISIKIFHISCQNCKGGGVKRGHCHDLVTNAKSQHNITYSLFIEQIIGNNMHKLSLPVKHVATTYNILQKWHAIQELTCRFFTDAFITTLTAIVLVVCHKRNVTPAQQKRFRLLQIMLLCTI